MSNTVFIQQEKVTARKSGNSYNQVSIHDNYSNVTLNLLKLKSDDSFFDDKIELLRWIVDVAMGNETLTVILSSAIENQDIFVIEDVPYSWEKVKKIMKEEGFFGFEG